MMSGIRAGNTRPEVAVRKFLFAAGMRFRLHSKSVPGRPDIVLPKYKAAVFVHGCFWHRHPNCRFSYMPRSNVAFWRKKFESNVARDQRVRELVRKAGWKAHTIWACEVNDKSVASLARKIARAAK
jgi:DNA mismatch endonuclease, patch repair protein